MKIELTPEQIDFIEQMMDSTPLSGNRSQMKNTIEMMDSIMAVFESAKDAKKENR